jgi:hypothetical protein
MGQHTLPMVLAIPTSPLSHGHVPMGHGTVRGVQPLYPMGHSEMPMVLPGSASHVPHGCGTVGHGTSQMFICHPIGRYTFPMVLIMAVPWDIRHLHPLSILCLGQVAMNHGTLISVPWASTQCLWSWPFPHYNCPMGHFNCSTCIPWAIIHCPWSFQVLNNICPMGMFQWTMGHSKCSTSFPWATTYSHGPASYLFCGSLTIIHGSLQVSAHGPLYIAHGHVQWTMRHYKC